MNLKKLSFVKEKMNIPLPLIAIPDLKLLKSALSLAKPSFLLSASSFFFAAASSLYFLERPLSNYFLMTTFYKCQSSSKRTPVIS
jgi:hypothetical protein